MHNFIRTAALVLLVASSVGYSKPAEARPMLCGAIERFMDTHDWEPSQNWAYSYYFRNCYGVD